MIAMLGHSEIDTVVSDAGMETMEFNDCRDVLEDNINANRVLAVIWEEARFSYKDGWKFIDLFTQSISRLYQMC